MGSSGRLITSSGILDGTIVNADVAAAAAILASKLAAGGTANRVMATADGTTMALQQITGLMIVDNSVHGNAIQDSSLTTGKINPNAVTQQGSSAWSSPSTSMTGGWALAFALPTLTYQGGQVRLDWQLLGNNGTASLGYIGYNVAGGGVSQMGLHQFTAGLYAQLSGFALLGALTGSVAINVYWQVSGGTLNANAGSMAVVTEYKK